MFRVSVTVAMVLVVGSDVLRSAERQTATAPAGQIEESPAAQRARKKADQYAEAARRFCPDLHRLETPHFWLYSSVDTKIDKIASVLAEEAYHASSTYLGVDSNWDPWPGSRCALYLFNQPMAFTLFRAQVLQSDSNAQANSFSRRREDLALAVFNKADGETSFCESLAFLVGLEAMQGSIGNTESLEWLSRGFGSYVGSILVPEGAAMLHCQDSTRNAVRQSTSISGIFAKEHLTREDEGVAQSVVQYLIQKDPKAFVAYLRLLQQKRANPEALQEAYSLNEAGLEKAWRVFAGKAATFDPNHPFLPAVPRQVESFQARAEEMFQKTKEFAANIHKVETAHFLIYTDWYKDQDKGLSEFVEKMYAEYCRQFLIPPKENIWAGKCPLYVFETTRNFTRFTEQVDHAERADAAGYCHGGRDGFVYVVMNHQDAADQFFYVMSHESTHAFLNRYLSNRGLPPWVHEGLAEHLASTLVPKCAYAKTFAETTHTAAKEKADVYPVFQSVPDHYWYDIAHSLISYLIARDSKAFVKYIQLLKQGVADEDALMQAYKLNYQTLVNAWRSAVK